MNLIDFLETWWLSVQPFLEAADVVGRSERSPTNRLQGCHACVAG